MILNSVVIDTNLVFSALIPKASQIRDILFESNMSFYSPNILISEIYKHKNKLHKNSKLTESEFYLYFNGIIEQIKFIPTDFIGLKSRQKAYDLCHDVDIKDTPFVALSIEFGIPLWTGDKKLKDGLNKKGFRDFYNQ
jgi:predicted nucleic acid-binding protein